MQDHQLFHTHVAPWFAANGTYFVYFYFVFILFFDVTNGTYFLNSLFLGRKVYLV
jgi:hypothetical protein